MCTAIRDHELRASVYGKIPSNVYEYCTIDAAMIEEVCRTWSRRALARDRSLNSPGAYAAD